jgi:hypothetical protein
MKNVIEEIKKDYEELKSLSVSLDDANDCIIIKGVRYRGCYNRATYSQINYLVSYPNVSYQSKSNLSKGNKWFLSACIDIVKKYPSYNFIITL